MSSYLDTRESSLGYLTSTAARLLGNRITRHFDQAGIDLTGEQWSLLIRLWDKDGQTQQALAASLLMEKSSVSRLLDGLERRGWIRREQDSEDARQKRIMLTEQGIAVQDKTIGIAQDVLQKAQELLSQDEKEMLRNLLLRVIRTLEKS